MVASISSSAHIELEIQELLVSGLSLGDVVSHLLKNYSKVRLDIQELETVSNFFLAAGYHFSLLQFLTQCLSRNLTIPWAHFCEALFLTTPMLTESIKSSLIKGAEAQGQLENLTLVSHLDHFDDRLVPLRQRRSQIQRELLSKRKEEMIATLDMLQAQGMHAEEEKLIERFNLIFPNDEKLGEIKKNKLKRRALGLVQEITSDNPRWIPLAAFEVPEKETLEILTAIENSMQSYLISHPDPDLAHDFAIAQIMWENYAAALRFTDLALEDQPGFPNLIWLKLEILFNLRRFLEVLDIISGLEHEWNNNPDAVFGLMYMKANCLWELSLKQQAIDIMDSVCRARPHFRTARIILSEWQGDSE